MSFTYFVKSLIVASKKFSELNRLKRDLISMVVEYKDCVKACEHQHSKRSDPHLYSSNVYSSRCKYNT